MQASKSNLNSQKRMGWKCVEISFYSFVMAIPCMLIYMSFGIFVCLLMQGLSHFMDIRRLIYRIIERLHIRIRANKAVAASPPCFLNLI